MPRRRPQGQHVLLSAKAAAWNPLHASHRMMRINHYVAYSLGGACTNQAESYFSRIGRSEMGVHHHFGGAYLDRYVREMAWRENHRRDDNGRRFRAILGFVAANGPSREFCGYWQRAERKVGLAA